MLSVCNGRVGLVAPRTRHGCPANAKAWPHFPEQTFKIAVLEHDAGEFFQTLVFGGTVLLMPKFDTRAWLALAQAHAESIWAAGTSGVLGDANCTLFLPSWLANDTVPLALGIGESLRGAQRVVLLRPPH